VKVFYDPSYVLAEHEFETTRKAGWVAESLLSSPVTGVELSSPEPLALEDLRAVHDWRYIDAVRTGTPQELAESQGFAWDPGLWTMVLSSNGGAVAAARTALRDGVAGSLSSGMHHARRANGAGFCTFNGLALAARALQREGRRRILILDLDAHCGGGTHDLVVGRAEVSQLDVSTDTFDAYAPEPADRFSLDLVRKASAYLGIIERRLEARGRGERFDLCLYNAGMDPYELCPVGGLDGIGHEILAQRERLVFEWCRARAIPVAFVLAGGYLGPVEGSDKPDLVALHRLTITAAAAVASFAP
jgi:acetoin utilization deacetylase AcuC-like enzyme